jgi:hypothetical protein
MHEHHCIPHAARFVASIDAKGSTRLRHLHMPLPDRGHSTEQLVQHAEPYAAEPDLRKLIAPVSASIFDLPQ